MSASDALFDREHARLVGELRRTPEDGALKSEAADLALRIRSRLIDLAILRADYGSEHQVRLEQCRKLAALAGDALPPDIHRELQAG